MASLTRTKTGWTARKVIPADVRSAYGKREEKKTWPAALPPSQAKAEHSAWLTDVQDRINGYRQAASQTPVILSQRQTRGLAGEWYKAKVAEYEDDPGTVEGWMASAELVEVVNLGDPVECIDEEDSDDERHRKRLWVDPSSDTRLRIQPNSFLSIERDALLQAKGLRLTAASSDDLLREMAELWLHLCALMERRAQGDYGPDPMAGTLPALETAPRKSPVAVSITQLFEDYASTGTASPHTIGKWRKVIALFVAHIGHDDAAKVTRADASGWFTALVAGGLTVKTVAMTYRAALSRVFKIAYDQGRLPANPFARLEVIGPKQHQTRHRSLTDTEAQTILAAALGEQPEGISAAHARARRWVPWVCAYTGARVNEITPLQAKDIRQVDGVWVIHILKTKTGKARMVPLHSHLIDQGFHKLGKAGDATPLFYDPDSIRKEADGHPLHTQMGSKLAKWVRGLGVTEVQSPNHGWRHRFKSLARRVRMDAEARDAIQGHAPKTEGQAYGEWDVETLRTEVEKLPKYLT